ncbi:insulinase family protein [Aestuariibacter salexigens]|uniref:insulinase family protein n=1 Tax=Aestuariibacter salexigens TaxID=226010 RepID=UPI000409EFF3|nr:insulinase family protein [Aestuariibacter salexigens]
MLTNNVNNWSINVLNDFSDHRPWQIHNLPNGLEMFCVQDTDIERYAMSVCIGAGHFHDPHDCPGLAHLLEHMLFLGNKYFPEPNQLHEHVSTCGGSVNAWTGTEFANFHFDCQPEGLELATVQLASMLICPLFERDALDREISAIDAEFKLKRNDELRRLYQVHKETCNPAHPFSKFSVGNDDVFRSMSLEQLQQKLVQFHQSHYHARNIKLAVIGPQIPDALLSLLAEVFSRVPPSPEGWICPVYPPLYRPQDVGVQINIAPLKQARRLIVSFALPSIYPYYRSKPLNVISHLLGDETKGSLLDYLKRKGWATSLSAGGGIQGSNFKDFNVNLQLTEQGVEEVDAILEAMFSTLRLVKRAVDEQWRFEEKATLAALAQRYGERLKPIDEAVHLSENLFHYPAEHALVADVIMDEANPNAMHDMLTYFTPENMRVKLIAPEQRTDREAKWYGTRYQVSPLAKPLLERLCAPLTDLPLSLPSRNPHMPKQLNILPAPDKAENPTAVIQTQNQSFWFLQDDKYKQPKGDCFISFDCEAVQQGIRVITHKRLWIACLMDDLNERFYQAGIAGLNFHVYSHQGGFSLHTSGFSERQLHLVEDILEDIHTRTDFSANFELLKKRQWQSLQNSLLNKPINRLFTRLSVLMQKHTYAPVDSLDIVKHATVDDIAKVQQSLLSGYHMESLLHGNWNKQQAEIFYRRMGDRYQCHSHCSRNPRAVADLRNSHGFVHEVESHHNEHAVVVYFQSPSASLSDMAKTILLEQLLATPFFNQLRTEQQLGYVVGSGYFPFNQHPGLAFYVQSPEHEVNRLVKAISDFIAQADKHINEYAPVWKNLKESVCNQLMEKDASLAMKSQRLWSAMGKDDVDFNRHRRLVDSVNQIGLEQIIDFASALNNRDGFGQLILYTGSVLENTWANDAISIEQLASFKHDARYIA